MPVLNVRLSLDELVEFKLRAQDMHTNVSEMVRRLVLAEVAPVRRRRSTTQGDQTDAAALAPQPLERTRRYRRRCQTPPGGHAERTAERVEPLPSGRP
jgi:hypothetical protein